jgi:hypothetical protein
MVFNIILDFDLAMITLGDKYFCFNLGNVFQTYFFLADHESDFGLSRAHQIPGIMDLLPLS